MGTLRDDQPKKPATTSERDGVANLGQLVETVSALSRAAINAAKQRGRTSKPTIKPSDSLAELRRRAKQARAELAREIHRVEHGFETNRRPAPARARRELDDLILKLKGDREEIARDRALAKAALDDAEEQADEASALLAEVQAVLKETWEGLTAIAKKIS